MNKFIKGKWTFLLDLMSVLFKLIQACKTNTLNNTIKKEINIYLNQAKFNFLKNLCLKKFKFLTTNKKIARFKEFMELIREQEIKLLLRNWNSKKEI